MDFRLTKQFVEKIFDNSAIPELQKYIKIKAKSPIFDETWEKNGFLKEACNLVKEWCLCLSIDGLSADVISPPQKTPLLLIEIEPTSDNNDTTLIYGHLDKQPEFSGWDKNKGPFKPVIENHKLYGRGSSDDGYSAFSALCAIKTLKEQGLKHNKLVLLIETGEESGSPDLPFYINEYKEKIGKVDLIICLDSGCGDYERFWITNSLRGTIVCKLEVKILTQGIHSGNSGIVASSFRILRYLLDRIEDPSTGKIKLKELYQTVPDKTKEMIDKSVQVLGNQIFNAIPFIKNAVPVSDNNTELLLNNTFRPALSYIGIDGMPDFNKAGSVLRPSTSVCLSLRIPPSIDPYKAMELLKKTLEKDPPYNSQVTIDSLGCSKGWQMPEINKGLFQAINESSRTFFNNDACLIGEGGSIPFMNLLKENFPEAQFIVTGVLGPNSNAHGPNEFLHIPYVKKLTCAIAHILWYQGLSDH